MKPTICQKIFSFSVYDIMSTAFTFICSKIIFELLVRVKHKWMWKQKSNIRVILKCKPVSFQSSSCESMSLIVTSLWIAS